VAACRRVLVDLEEAEIAAGGERAAPRGILTLIDANPEAVDPIASRVRLFA
jgi:hypothetical protein